MSLQLPEELAPGDLERKWTKLSQVSGGFRKVKDAVIAHQAAISCSCWWQVPSVRPQPTFL